MAATIRTRRDQPRWPYFAAAILAPLVLAVEVLIPELAPKPAVALGVLAFAIGVYGAAQRARRPADVPSVSYATPAPVSRVAVEPPSVKSEDIAELRRELARHQELERQLTTAKQEAEAATMAKSEFLATMSHEIRTPLNGIIPLLDLLHSTPLGPDQRDYVVTAYTSARQLLSIVDDILDYSKIEAHKLELETVGINLKEILDSVTRLLGKSAESKALKLTVNIEPNVRLAMRGDPTRLRQVLSNLVSNAIKFTERGGVTIDVKRRGDSRSHTDVLFSVTDTGVGMTPEAQARLFKAFQQADTSTTRMHGGTGLGLVICKRIVELMNGEIGVRSQPGKGSTFWFSVPLMKAVGDVVPPRTDLHGSRAMVLGTDPATLKRISQMLNTFGVQHVQSTVAADALAKLRTAGNTGEAWAYDFLIVDWGSVLRNSAISLTKNVLRETALDSVHLVAIVGDEDLPPEIRQIDRLVAFERQVREADLRAGMQRLLDGEGEKRAKPASIDGLLPELRAAEPVTPITPMPAVTASRPAPTPAPAASGAQAVGGHVLLVEDNAVNRQVAQRLLSLAGVSFDWAENGKQAVEKLETEHYDAVLMDCMMPVLDGYGATRALRKMEADGKRPGRIPVIAMTANAMAGDREKCLAAGMDDYMSKPLNRALLEQTLKKWLPEKPAARAPGAAQAQASAARETIAAPSSLPTASAPVTAARAAAAPAAPSRPAVDQEIIQDLLEMMGTEFTELVRVYLEDTPKSIVQLDNAARVNDLDGLVGPAHSLKSTSANLGALGLSELAKRIEHGARQKNLPGPPSALVAELASEFARVSAELKKLLATATN